jgi:hypothetical protein
MAKSKSARASGFQPPPLFFRLESFKRWERSIWVAYVLISVGVAILGVKLYRGPRGLEAEPRQVDPQC